MRVGHELARRAGSLGRESLFVESGVCRRRNTGESGSPTRRRRPRIGGLERVLVRARSLRRASVAPHGRGTRPEQPDDRARCFCVSWLINISLARTPAFRGKMSRLLSAFFTRVARAHAGRASSHSTPAACRPPNLADGSHLTSPLLPPPAVYQNPDGGGVARPADVALVRKTGQRDGPESNGPAQRVEPRCRSRPIKSNPVFGFVVHGTGVTAHCPRHGP